MSPQQFEEEMIFLKAKYGDDEELCHIKMDELMCEVLMDLGYEAGVEIFENTPKWCS